MEKKLVNLFFLSTRDPLSSLFSLLSTSDPPPLSFFLQRVLLGRVTTFFTPVVVSFESLSPFVSLILVNYWGGDELVVNRRKKQIYSSLRAPPPIIILTSTPTCGRSCSWGAR